MHLEGARLDHSNPRGISKIKELYLLRQNTIQSIDKGLSERSIKVGIQGSQTNPGEANPNTCNSIEHVSTIIIARQRLRQVRISNVFQEAKEMGAKQNMGQVFI